MDSGPVVDVFTVVLCLRLMDMQKMCESLAMQCEDKKMVKLARRFGRAAASFKEMQGEISAENRQTSML